MCNSYSKTYVFFNNKRKEKQLKPIAIGIGIHWAELIIGTIGEKYRMAGTVISSGVNLSSRLENLTKFYKAKILVSATVVNKLDKSLDIKYRFLGNISLQGISNKVLIYEILDCYLEEDFHKRVMTKVDFEKGEMVRIVDGPFANFTGMVEEYDLDHGKLKLNVSIFGRNTPVEILYTQVEKII